MGAPTHGDVDPAAHRAVTQREFTRQADGFERPGSLFADRNILDWIESALAMPDGGAVLDVAGGTGQLGRRLAGRAAFAVIADLTPEMLARGARAAREASTRNVAFVEADATALPFPAGQFDLVVCRFAIHHIDDPPAAVREMARVCAPGGRVAVIDMVRDPGAEGTRLDELERLRDPSHRSALTEPELLAAMSALVEPRVLDERRQRMPAGPWLDQAEPGAPERARVQAALEQDADGGEPTGLRAARDEQGRLAVEHRWLIAAGEVP